MAIVEDAYVYEEETHLTVLKTSLFFAGDGFTAYDSRGELVFRVDSYGPDAGDSGELVLMDASGRCILTVRRKRPSLHQRWEGYAGEGAEGKKPLFSVRRSSIIGRSGMTVEVYNPGSEYQIEGSFACRSCTILNADKEEVAEIRRKVDATTNVVLGKDVFLLAVKPGFDGAFAMGLVLVLDQIHGGDEDEAGGGADGVKVGVEPNPAHEGAILGFVRGGFITHDWTGIGKDFSHYFFKNHCDPYRIYVLIQDYGFVWLSSEGFKARKSRLFGIFRS
ncbi:Protein LURP-one-related 12 [Striga hermonthica]|uniref:Protein LURP-one-related 12 n=1 Tax=Striga hermonthica TaxID=68872 RepID=A0A9N7N953_STRHE|nr:Protein LURP-one-related 12 [Striga hermonthica]